MTCTYIKHADNIFDSPAFKYWWATSYWSHLVTKHVLVSWRRVLILIMLESILNSSHRSSYRLLSVGRSLLYLEVATTIIIYFNYHQLIPKSCLPLVPLSSFFHHHQPGSRSPPDQSLRHFEFKHLLAIGNHIIYKRLETASQSLCFSPSQSPCSNEAWCHAAAQLIRVLMMSSSCVQNEPVERMLTAIKSIAF